MKFATSSWSALGTSFLTFAAFLHHVARCNRSANWGMSGVFISYARADEALAWRITRWLRSLDVHVWWDQDMASVDWHYELVDRITDLAAVVVIWSPNSWKSKSVRDEARLADDQGKLVNLIIDVPKPLHPFDRITGVDLGDWWGPGSNALGARIVLAIDRHLADAGAIAKGELIARQAEQYREFQKREADLAAIEADLAAAEVSAREAIDAIDAESAALAEADADLANVRAIGLSRSVASAAEEAARKERDAAEIRLRAARTAADSSMKRASALAADRDKMSAVFRMWQVERGAPQEASDVDDYRKPLGVVSSGAFSETMKNSDLKDEPPESELEPVASDWPNDEMMEAGTSPQSVAESSEFDWDEQQDRQGPRVSLIAAIIVVATLIVTSILWVFFNGTNKTASVDYDVAKASPNALSAAVKGNGSEQKGAATDESAKAGPIVKKSTVVDTNTASPGLVSVPAWLVGKWGRDGKCSVIYTLADGKKGLLNVNTKSDKDSTDWSERIISSKPNNKGQERIETDQTYYVREANDSMISVVPKVTSKMKPFKLSSIC
jgi:hypothetical protein